MEKKLELFKIMLRAELNDIRLNNKMEGPCVDKVMYEVYALSQARIAAQEDAIWEVIKAFDWGTEYIEWAYGKNDLAALEAGEYDHF